jgi:hypothetical protein
VIDRGSLRGEKVQYPDLTWCCIWRTFPNSTDDIGMCFDFLADDLDDLIELLVELRDTEPEIADD